jgi:beta-N-acetylhexosaminidase
MSADQEQPDIRGLALRVLMASFEGEQVPGWMLRRLGEGLGSVCLFGSNLGSNGSDDAQARRTTDTLRAASTRGCLVAVDEEGGDVTRLDVDLGSRVPGAAALGAVDDVELTRRVAAGVGRRLRAAGIDLDLAPVADVNSEPDNPVIGVRSFGADPHLVARHVVASVEGLQGEGVAACVKHFPGHGATTEDSHVAAPRLDLSLELLGERELVPFAAAVGAGVAAVMTSHVLVPALDAERPATTSPTVLGLLRTGFGFDGLIVSDALDMAGVRVPYGGEPYAAVASLAAGADLLCLCADGDEAFLTGVVDEVMAAVGDGRLPLARLAEAAGRVDALVDRLAGRPAAGAADPGAADEAARRALRLDGELPGLAGALVLEFEVAPGIAAGALPWGIGEPLAQLLPGVEQRSLFPGDDLPPADGRPLVAVVRDAHRHPWVAAALVSLLADRPDTVVVETGWPGPDPLPGRVRLWTYGASRATREAAAELLAGVAR